MSEPSTIRDEDYEAIEAAVMETARGRWFLQEYARRNRNSDTKMLLGAIKRVEDALSAQLLAQKETETMRAELVEMGTAIAKTRKEIAALKPEGSESGIFSATDELESIVKHTEKATGEILSTAEHIQEIAWTLREAKVDEELCARLDGFATDIYIACSFQDLTGQRTARVVNVLQTLEKRINSMVDIWYLEEEEVEEDDITFVDQDRHLLNGPTDNGLRQDSVDVLIDDHAAYKPEKIDAKEEFEPIPDDFEVGFADDDEPVGLAAHEEHAIHAMVEAAQDAQMEIAEERAAHTPEMSEVFEAVATSDDMDVDSLSDGQKAALFS